MLTKMFILTLLIVVFAQCMRTESSAVMEDPEVLQFDKEIYTILFPSEPTEAVLLRVNATGAEGIAYALESEGDAYTRYFSINAQSGDIIFNPVIGADAVFHELKSEDYITLYISAQVPDRPDVSIATAQVTMLNEEGPFKIVVSFWTIGTIGIAENADVGSMTTTVDIITHVNDPVENIQCLLADDSDSFELVSVHNNAYKLITTTVLDREVIDSYWVFIVCSSSDNPPVRMIQKIHVDVFDDNDNSPVFTQSEYQVSIPENTEPFSSLLSVSATDADIYDNGRITYSVQVDQHFVINGWGNQSNVISLAFPVDRETMDTFSFYVIAKDQGFPQRSATATVTVTVTDVNDVVPIFSMNPYFFVAARGQAEGTEVGMVSAVDTDAPPFNEFVLELFPESDTFEINADTGRITLKSALGDDSKPVYHLTVVARDIQPPAANSTADVFIFVVSNDD